MTKEHLQQDLTAATEKLLDLAKAHAWNAISDNCLYIISEVEAAVDQNFFAVRKIRKQSNQHKQPKPLPGAVSELKRIYVDLYDVYSKYSGLRMLTCPQYKYSPMPCIVCVLCLSIRTGDCAMIFANHFISRTA
ncbi:MAG: hypothetical protein IPL65_09755 [Lewinellaceae bacterium]|nr:hypothetical protein [Lewinellaceae bacterium]